MWKRHRATKEFCLHWFVLAASFLSAGISCSKDYPNVAVVSMPEVAAQPDDQQGAAEESDGPSQIGRGLRGQYVYWVCMVHPSLLQWLGTTRVTIFGASASRILAG